MTQQLNYDAGNKGDYNHKTCNANMALQKAVVMVDLGPFSPLKMMMMMAMMMTMMMNH